MTNIFSKIGRIASRAGKVFKPRHGPRHGIRHYARKHSANAGLVAGGVALGAGSDLVIDAIRGGEDTAPPTIYMEGGEDAVNIVSDDS